MTPPSPPAGFTAGGRFRSWRPAEPAWVLLDVDGTLVARDGVRPAVRRAARAAVAAGLRVGVVTGRMRQAALPIIAELGLDGPHVLHNGAEIHDGVRPIGSFPLPAGAVDALVELSEASGAYAELYDDEGYVVTRYEPRAHPHWELLGSPPRGLPANLDGAPVLKATFMCFDDEATLQVVVRGIRAAGLQPGPAHSPVTPGVTYVNATASDVDKGSALAAAATTLGIDLAAVVGVGDGDNDVPMFARVGTAIAMGQAERPVQAASHLVAPSVDDDGAAHVLLWLAAEVAAVN